jgi:hypothetical protein
MGRQVVRLADGSGFTVAGERVNRGMVFEPQLEDDVWVPGAIEWSPTLDHAVLFIVKLGGPHERHDAPGPEMRFLLNPAEAYFCACATSRASRHYRETRCSQ